jgi:hypothetical protein
MGKRRYITFKVCQTVCLLHSSTSLEAQALKGFAGLGCSFADKYGAAG